MIDDRMMPRLVKLSKFPKCGLFEPGSEPSRSMLDDMVATAKFRLPLVRMGGNWYVDISRLTAAVIEQAENTEKGKRLKACGSVSKVPTL